MLCLRSRDVPIIVLPSSKMSIRCSTISPRAVSVERPGMKPCCYLRLIDIVLLKVVSEPT